MAGFNSLAPKSHEKGSLPLSRMVILILVIGIVSAIVFLALVAPIVGQEKTKAIFDFSDDWDRLFVDLNNLLDTNKIVSQSFCGNGVCESGESVSNCLQDCFVCNSNGTCEPELGENTNTCSTDCHSVGGGGGGGGGGGEPPAPYCGDNACNGSENCSSCSTDCGNCPPVCGNNVREGSEVCDGSDLAGQTCQSKGYFSGILFCETNCSSFDTAQCTNCGNGVCDNGETLKSCSQDCQQSLFVSCENGFCDNGETIGSCPMDCQPAEPALDELQKPNFAITIQGGSLVQYFQDSHAGYSSATRNGNQWQWPDDAYVQNASVTYLGNGEWKLEFTPKQNLSKINFPWRTDAYAVNGSIEDDKVFFTFLGGVFEKEEAYDPGNWSWRGHDYPGHNFAPLIVVADNQKALLMAANNWPARHVFLYHTHQKLHIDYPNSFSAGTPVQLHVILQEFTGSTTAGYYPWQLAMQRYKTWLDSVSPTPNYPAWLQESEGFLNVQMENQTVFDLPYIQNLWNQWKNHFKWILFWGQMSNYGDLDFLVYDPPLIPWNGINPNSSLFDGQPMIQINESVGCCLPHQTMHTRYSLQLPSFVQSVVNEGFHAGYYQRKRPFYNQSTYEQRYCASPLYTSDCCTQPTENQCLLDNSEEAVWVQNWFSKSQNEYFANSYYFDELARRYMGEPNTVLSLFSNGTIPVDLVMEGFVDIYPRAGFLSGYYRGDDRYTGGPGINPQTANQGTFPNLARFLMGNRIGFLGQSNGDHVFFGPSANYWLERQIFLLGTKGDIFSPNLESGQANPYLLDIKAKRDAANWWNHSPIYLDSMGLTEVPTGIDARRFKTNDGKEWIAIDNPSQLSGLSLKVKGKTIPIPPQKLSFVEAN